MKRAVVIITVLLFAFSLFAVMGCGKKEEPMPAPKPVVKPVPAPVAPAAAIKKIDEPGTPEKPAGIKKSEPKPVKKAKGMKKKGK